MRAIDAVDARIQTLISERARYAQAVGDLEGRSGARRSISTGPSAKPQVLRKALERNKGPLRNEEMVRLFREIMSACLAQQEPLKVAFLGPEGTFTQAAVLKHFGHSVHALPLTTIDEVFHEVEAGTADFGVVPVENSTEGTVNNTLDMFLTLAAQDLRRDRAADPSAPDGARWSRSATSSASARTRSRSRSAAHGSMSTCRKSSASRSSSNAEAARRARDEDGTAAHRRRGRGQVYGLDPACHGRRGPARQHDALRRRRAQALPAERQGQDVDSGDPPRTPKRRARCCRCSARSRATAST